MTEDMKESITRVARDSPALRMGEAETVCRAGVLAGDEPNRAAVRHLTRHASAAWRPGWGPTAGDQIRDAAARRADSIRVAARSIRDRFWAGPELFWGSAVAEFLGGLGRGHGLACDLGDYVAEQQEPQITGALANALHARGMPIRWQRIRTFLQALGVEEGLLRSLEGCKENPERVVVQAEDPTDDGRRMDLRISWPGEDPVKLDGVVIEAKFGHEVTEGQLPAYESWAQRYLNPQGSQLILLTVEGEQAQADERFHWHPVSWLQLMRRWEGLLPDAAQELALVKQLIWQKRR